MIVTIKNPDVSQNIKTFLSTEYTSGTTLNVDSSTSFVDTQYILVGEPGLENSEITSLTATPPTNTTMTVGTLKFSHPRGTPIYYISWDKYTLDYYVSGAWTTYVSMPSALTYDAQNTEYRDASATSAYSWRYRYYSTENSAYSDYSDTITATGWPKKSVGYMVREVRKIVNDPDGKTLSDEQIIRYLNKAQDKIFALFGRWWFLYKTGTAIDTVASTKTYDLPSDFGRMHTVLFNYAPSDGTSDITYNLRYLPTVEFDYESRNNDASDSDEIKYYTIVPGDSDNAAGYLKIWPKPETAGFDIIPRYYKTFTDLDSFADETDIPIPSILEDYAMAEVYKIRGDEQTALYYDKLFREQIELLKLMQRKQVGQPKHLWKWEGRNAENRLFGKRSLTTDADRERNW